VKISGIFADVEIRQFYGNTGKKVLEAVYVFPGSTRAAVHGLEMRIGDRAIVAEVEERRKAKAKYEQAKEENKTAALLEQERPNLFQMSVGHILPGDEIEVRLQYTEVLTPAEWEGEPLAKIPLSDREKAFARTFPGRLGIFETADGRRIILRWVTRPTRKLHSSADCLRASGFTLKNRAASVAGKESWRCFKASHPDWGSLELREQVRSAADPARCWSEIPAWFWAASFQPHPGPWWAITVMEPRES
jgi:hypothetical protein